MLVRSFLRQEWLAKLDERTLICVGTIAPLVMVHALLRFHPAFDLAYLVPAIVAYRSGGYRGGLLVLVLAALAVSLAAWPSYGVAGAIFRLVALGAIIAVVALTNESKLIQDGSSDPVIAISIDCEGFLDLNDQYDSQAAIHATRMLIGALEQETREGDLVAAVGPTEYVVVMEGIDIRGARAIMERVRAEFERRLTDAGYECDLDFAAVPVESESRSVGDFLPTPPVSMRQAYLN